MSWASRRRTTYLTGIVLFILIVFGGPITYHFLTVLPTCHEGIRNHGETAVDKGGPCLTLDPAALQPASILWARSFHVRDGSYSAVAYIENPNEGAGVMQSRYHFGLYDSANVLVADVNGTTFIMPGGITPVFAGGIATGNRIVAHTYLELSAPLVWTRAKNAAAPISVSNKQVSEAAPPTVSADVENTSVVDIVSPSFSAVVFDTQGNAIAASSTVLPRLVAGETAHITFTWPDTFSSQVGRVDIIPEVIPVADPSGER